MKKVCSYLLLATLLVCPGLRAETLLVVPQPSALTRDLASRLMAHPELAPVTLSPISQAQISPATRRVITLGQEALDWRLAQPENTATIAAYISIAAAPEKRPDWLQIMLSNPAPWRQVRLARAMLPRVARLGVIYSEHSIHQLDAWQQAAETSNLQLVSRYWEPAVTITRPLRELLNSSDVILALDDEQIWNADQLKTILLTSYARDRVIIGPAAAFVDAGSLGTTYSTASDNVLSLRQRFNQPWQPGALFYPSVFSVHTNAQVARSLSLPAPDNDALLERLKAEEKAP